MSRVLTVAISEYTALVRTKFFVISLLMLPVILAASVGFNLFAAKRVDRQERRFAVIDHTGVLYPVLVQAAADHNDQMGSGSSQKGPHFAPVQVDPAGRSDDDLEVELSARVKSKDLFAFIDIPAGVLEPASKADVEYFTETPSFNALPDWLQKTVGEEIIQRRFARASVDSALVAKLNTPVDVSTLGLVQRAADGSVTPAKKTDEIQTFVLPFALMYLMFLSIVATAPHQLNAVIEEKMSKISEVLVSSVTPFQLMLGKLAGTVALSLTLASVYLVGGIYALIAGGRIELLNPALIGWFLVFLVCAVLMFGSVFLAVGAAASDLKDAQGMMQPAMFIMILPMVASPVVLRAPDSGLAVFASLFPTSAPFIMMIRLAMTPAPPIGRVIAAVALMLVTAVTLVWCAGRIFRFGLLMQGKGATLAEMIRWIRA